MATNILLNTGRVQGTLSPVTKTLTGSIHGTGAISGHVTVPSSQAGGGYDEYDGEYIITPQPWDEIVLETENKILTDNVVVLEIPYFETANLSGGNTVYIGGS